MSYLIHPIENGKFEIIDADFVHLYDLDTDELIVLSDDEHQAHIKRANHLTTFEDGKFVYRDVITDEKAIKKSMQSQIWEQIKQKRHHHTHSGVYLSSVGKWFHTDESSRTQYLALQILPQLPEDLQWKTMDNSFVPLTKPLLTELAMTILAQEQANFANAEQHRLVMLQADNPLAYDFSTGWSTTFDSQNSQGAGHD